MSEVERYWIDPNRLVQEGWHQDDTCVVKDWAYDRVVAERDALQQRLTAADERADLIQGLLLRLVRNIDQECCCAEDLEQQDNQFNSILKSIRAALKPAQGGGDDA